MTEDEMVRWHHRLNGHEFEQTPGDSEGQGSLVCCSTWGCRVRHNLATEQQQRLWNKEMYIFQTLLKRNCFMVKETLAAETCILVNCKITPFTPLLFSILCWILNFNLIVFFVLTLDPPYIVLEKQKPHTSSNWCFSGSCFYLTTVIGIGLPTGSCLTHRLKHHYAISH